MKNTWKVPLVLFLLALMRGPLVLADELKGTGNALAEEMMKTALGQERIKAFEGAMNGVSVDEQQKFWDEYKAYAAEKEKFDTTRFQLMDQYMTNYLLLTPAQTRELMDRWIKLQEDELQARIKMFKRLSKKVSPLVGARFYQVDDYVYSALKVQYMSNYPIFGQTRSQ